MLPPALGTLRDPEDRAMEYMHYRQFFSVWSILSRVVECAALEGPHMNKEARAEWLEEYKVCILCLCSRRLWLTLCTSRACWSRHRSK